jgi:hypothetical protein
MRKTQNVMISTLAFYVLRITNYHSPMAKLKTFLDMVRFEHTIFALPFAYLGMVLAWGSWEAASWWDFVWITVARAAARTAAMSLNRYTSPRTRPYNHFQGA